MKRRIIFICTSNKDRSPALEKYFSAVYPQHEYRSAGINKYFCTTKGTHYLMQEDLDWADLVVFAEDIHCEVTKKNFSLGKHIKIGEKIGKHHLPPIILSYVILNCGEYAQGCVNDDYLTKAEEKLKTYL